MRDIKELIDKEKPREKMTDDEVIQRIIAEDQRNIREFHAPQEPQGPSWGIRKKWGHG